MIIIKKLHFEDYEDFTCAVSDVYDRVKSKDEYGSVDIIAKYDEAKEIICELIAIGYNITFIDGFVSPEWNTYDDAFVISLLEDEIWCEPIKRENEYILVETEVAYILDNCSSKIISNIEADEVYEVEIENDDDDCDCENCDCHDMATTTSSTSYEINGKEVTKEEYDKAIEDISSFLSFVNKIWDII